MRLLLTLAVAALAAAAAGPGPHAGPEGQEPLFRTGFESDTWWEEWGLRERPATAETVAADPERRFEPLSGKALRARVPQGQNTGLNILYRFQRQLGFEPEEVYFRYHLRLADDWHPREGGKLPGVSGTYGRAGWGGRPVNGRDGWSARGLYDVPRAGRTRSGFYAYHMDMQGRYGSHWRWERDGFPGLENNRWYAIEQQVRMNTPGRADGILRAWVDDRLVFEKTDVRMRDVPELKIEAVWLNVYHGGSLTAERDHHLYIDDVTISRARIGPAAQQTRLPEGPGLAARYPGDAGIARDPAVILHEDFEVDSLAELERRWDSISNREGRVVFLSDETPPGSAGRRSVRLTATVPENTGGHLYMRLPREAETAFLRFYVKFPPEGEYIHHFVHLGGYRPPTPWPQGGAGTRPEGHERFTVGIEPTGANARHPAPGVWNFYNYWAEMKVSADGRYWGNGLQPAEPLVVPKERWQCVEVMVKLNSTPEARDGELALWLDGRLAAHFYPGVRRGPWSGMGFQLVEAGGEPFEGFRWRTHPELKVNFLWLLHYVTEESLRRNRSEGPPRPNSVWFDDMVVATEYIGPVQPG